MKAFSVYADKRKSQEGKAQLQMSQQRKSESNKRALDSSCGPTRPTKFMRPNETFQRHPRPIAGTQLSQAHIEDLISRRIDEKLAEKALGAHSQPVQALPDDLQRRLDALEQRVSEKEDGSRGEGLQFLLMAKQHAARGEDCSALRMYELALPYFEGNGRLEAKIRQLKEKIRAKKGTADLQEKPIYQEAAPPFSRASPVRRKKAATVDDAKDDDYIDDHDGDGAYNDEDEDEHRFKSRSKALAKPKTTLRRAALPSFTLIPPRPGGPLISSSPDHGASSDSSGSSATLVSTPRTAHLLHIINTRDIVQIRSLKGVGAKRAEAIVGALCEMDVQHITDLAQLGALKGVGVKTVENMRAGVPCV